VEAGTMKFFAFKTDFLRQGICVYHLADCSVTYLWFISEVILCYDGQFTGSVLYDI